MGKKRRDVRCREKGDSGDMDQSVCELRGRWGLHTDQVFKMAHKEPKIEVKLIEVWVAATVSFDVVALWERFQCILISKMLEQKTEGGGKYFCYCSWCKSIFLSERSPYSGYIKQEFQRKGSSYGILLGDSDLAFLLMELYIHQIPG